MIPLTARELQIAELLVEGTPYKAIGFTLGISPRTAEVHARNIFKKLGVRNQAQAAVMLSRPPYTMRSDG